MVDTLLDKERIFNLSVERVAEIYGRPHQSIELKLRFDSDLQPTFVSDFKNNEYDKLTYDVHDVADTEIAKQIKAGKIVINKVEDYCEYMWLCFQRNQELVMRVLGGR